MSHLTRASSVEGVSQDLFNQPPPRQPRTKLLNCRGREGAKRESEELFEKEQ